MAMTQAEWTAKGLELFGEDRENWAFACPMCGNEMSIARARRDFPELKGCKWAPHQECIGRYTRKVDCDWCAYGLFPGPVIVTMEDGKEVATFEFAAAKAVAA